MQEKLITSTPREKINPLAFQNSFVYDCYIQIRSILHNKLSEKHANIFAEPVFDSLNNCIDWYSPINGEIKLLSQCSAEQQNIIKIHLATLAQEISKCAHDLKKGQNNTHVIAGNILELALLYPDEDSCIYTVGNQPIIICWGFEPASAGVQAQDLSRLSTSISLKKEIQTPKPVEDIAPPIQLAETLIPNNAPEKQVENKTARFNLAWLIIPLILLLLLLLLYLFCSGRLGILGFTQPNCSWFNFSKPSISLDKASPKNPNNLNTQQLADLYLKLEKARALCLSKPKEVIPTINLPQDIKSLQGTWICETDIVTSKNIPVIMTFTFNDKGIGEVSIDSSGDICTAPTKVMFSASASFTITTDTQIECKSGSAFAKQNVSCVNTAQGTMCTGRNLNDSSTWNATFQKSI